MSYCPNAVAANEKVLWKLGNLKTFCPNVRRYKLLYFNYLQMIGQFPSAETKVQTNYRSSITSVRPNCHNTMLAAVNFSSAPHCFLKDNQFCYCLSVVFSLSRESEEITTYTNSTWIFSRGFDF